MKTFIVCVKKTLISFGSKEAKSRKAMKTDEGDKKALESREGSKEAKSRKAMKTAICLKQARKELLKFERS